MSRFIPAACPSGGRETDPINIHLDHCSSESDQSNAPFELPNSCRQPAMDEDLIIKMASKIYAVRNICIQGQEQLRVASLTRAAVMNIFGGQARISFGLTSCLLVTQ